jgi:hypothetical protein
MSRDAGQAHLDVYLEQVRRHLRGLSETETRETLAELRSHVLDRVDGDLSPAKVEAAIEALGSPREVARLNVAERAVSQIDADRSLLAVPRAIARLATLSLYGFFAFLVSFTGYGIGGALLLTAVVKPFAPSHVGLWRMPSASDDYSYSLGVVSQAPQAHELLGWWIIPVGLVGGTLAVWATWQFGRFSVRLMAGVRRPRSGGASKSSGALRQDGAARGG